VAGLTLTSRLPAPNPAPTRNPDSAEAERFAPIEGLRAWLAWGVFVGHVVLFAGLSRIGIPTWAGEITTTSVEVFIIVSGFVITHLLLSRQENYLPYIAKRFFRLFPAFVVCAAVGATAIAISRTPWPGDATYQYGRQLIALQDAQAHHLPAHVLLHLVMLHGAIPSNVLDVSQWALLPTAWSISLEWQFYLVAPAVLLLFRRKGGAVVVSLLTVAGLWLYNRGDLGAFESPSFLPGAGEFFLLGIVCRLYWDEFKPPAPATVAIAALAVGCLADQMAIAIWLAFLTYAASQSAQLGGINRRFVSMADTLFVSRIAQWAGKRTYCVYLVHYPIYQLLLTALTMAALKPPTEVAAALIVLGFPLTVVAAEALHRYVELPGMNLGKEIARRLGAVSKSGAAPRALATEL
jgi:peptidoglycan/LPS O-acetylase OafA/YrhL